MLRRWLLLVALGAAPLAAGIGARTFAAEEDLAELLSRIGASIEQYFARVQSLICVETVTVQTIGHDLAPDHSPARRLQYELRLTWEPSAEGKREVSTQRQLLKVGSRAPRPKDKPRCTDPLEVVEDPLGLLLPENQKDSSFSISGRTRLNGRQTLMLNYRPLEVGEVSAKAFERDDCFILTLNGRDRGRFWVDVETADVLRHDTWLRGMFDVDLPKTKDWGDRQPVTFERLDSTTLYRPVRFQDPDEVIMLPSSVERVQVVRNSSSLRMRHTFSAYRRFLTSGRIVQN
jgi:hypothetical protein